MTKKKKKRRPLENDFFMIEPSSEISLLRKKLRKFDQSKLIAVLAGLRVHPRNHSQALRLEIASLAACSIKRSGKRKIKTNQLQEILNGCLPAQSYFGMMEDPNDNLFTENIQFSGGNYIVYPGITQEGSFILRTLLRSIFFDREELPRDFLATIQAAILSLLLLSDEIANRLGHHRYMDSPDRWRQNPEVPDSNQMSKLSRAVTFTRKEIDSLFRRIRFNYPLFSPFITQIAAPELLENNPLDNNPLLTKPLVLANDRIILTLPDSVTSALRHFTWVTSKRIGIHELIARRFRKTLWMNLQKCLIRIFFEFVDLEIPPWKENLPVNEGIFRIDKNKLAYVQLVVDDASDYLENEPFGAWNSDDLNEKICDRQEVIVKWLTDRDQPLCQEVFLIVVLGGIGRNAFFDFGKGPSNTRLLLISAEDLEIISQLGDCDNLTLWKFAGSKAHLLDSTRVSQHSFLDIYALYLDYHHSFNLSDEKNFSYISIVPGHGRSLRVKAAKINDVHAVLKGSPPYYVSVCRCYDDESIPIYFMDDAIGESLDLLVEGYSFPIWVGPREKIEEIPKEFREIYSKVTDMFAYWIWQVTPSLRPHLELLGKFPIEISFSLGRVQNWIISKKMTLKEKESLGLKSEIHGRTIGLSIPDTILPDLQGADNQGERLILDILMQSFDGILDRNGQPHNIDEKERKRILDMHAPLGFKKKLFIIDISKNISLNPYFLPRYRTIPEHDIEEQLDRLVEALGEQVPTKEVVVEKEKRTKFLERIVDVYLHRLKAILPRFAWQSLLEQLIGYNEALWYHREFRRFTIPTTIECFTGLQSHVENLAKELPELGSTALTVRTLIEIVAAEPPNGNLEVSKDELDKLLAITYHIVNWATMSDQIHLGILDHELIILPSGRIGTERKEFENVWDPFIRAKTVEKVEWAMDSFQGQFEVEEEFGEVDLQRTEFESVFEAEFGLTLTQIGKFYDCLIQLGFDQKTVAPHLRLSKLRSKMKDDLGWESDRIDRAIDIFSLSAREKWERAPEGFDAREDVWPWRYNRRLSFMRRPLIIGPEPEDDPLVFWGPRHADMTREYLVSLVVEGRYKIHEDTSEEMRTFIGKIQNESSKEFVRDVKRWFEENTKWQVATEVPMKPGAALDPGIDLGDIDILAFDNTNRRIYSIECKNVNYGRNPREIANEIERVMGKNEMGDSWINKHLKRDKWLRSSVDTLSSVYNLSLNFQ